MSELLESKFFWIWLIQWTLLFPVSDVSERVILGDAKETIGYFLSSLIIQVVTALLVVLLPLVLMGLYPIPSKTEPRAVVIGCLLGIVLSRIVSKGIEVLARRKK